MGARPTKQLSLTRVRELFSGGMARLTLAHQGDGRQVVIRELLRRNLFRVRFHLRFVNGTRIREELTPHHSIVGSIRRGYARLVPYEIIEYIDGHSLRKLIQNRDPLIAAHSLQILREAAAGLAYVHGKGVIHLDVKAENYLVAVRDAGIVVKLTDFDLSMETASAHRRQLAGTEAYVAPEQVKHGVIGPAADVFAFGIMAYYLVTGRMPFQGTTKKERLWQQISESFSVAPPRSLNPQLAPKIESIIMSCLEKDPAKRFPSMSYLCKELGGT